MDTTTTSASSTRGRKAEQAAEYRAWRGATNARLAHEYMAWCTANNQPSEGCPWPGPPEHPLALDEEVRWHEAGHVLMALAFGQKITSITVDNDTPENLISYGATHGQVEVAPGEELAPLQMALITAAGLAATKVLRGSRFKTKEFGDLDECGGACVAFLLQHRPHLEAIADGLASSGWELTGENVDDILAGLPPVIPPQWDRARESRLASLAAT
ncbi:MAG: hypothetical protein EPO40_17735 [Myxococcaceae bacterium]|nr:MAG: hypothetical protein EPO40_17735 [Myxococcaceae bacterium]